MSTGDVPFWHPANLIATCGGVGRLPLAPGTWGSLAALPFAWLIAAEWGPVGLGFAALVALLAGIWAAGEIETRSGLKDPGHIVIDEVAGQWLALAPVAPDPIVYLVGFLAFRLFDIVKPWPARLVERRLPGGAGVMLDDMVAGLYAGIVTYLVARAME